MQHKKKEAEAIVKLYVEETVKVGLIPIPLLDVYLVLKKQSEMLKELCDLYEAPYSKVKVERFITSMITGGLLVRYGGSMAKLFPYAGWAVGMASMAVASGATTFALGRIAINYLEKEGNLDNAFGEKAQAAFEDAVAEGESIVEEVIDAVDGKSDDMKETVDEFKDDVKDTVDEIKDVVEDAVGELRNAVDEIRARLKNKRKWKKKDKTTKNKQKTNIVDEVEVDDTVEEIVEDVVDKIVEDVVDTQAVEFELLMDKLTQLKEAGVLTEKEFEIKRKKIEKMMGKS